MNGFRMISTVTKGELQRLRRDPWRLLRATRKLVEGSSHRLRAVIEFIMHRPAGGGPIEKEQERDREYTLE
ncbi:hypothetical protein DBY65_019610 [Pseudomonas sp. RIT412]|nr:hypothetical protein DBY65_019610 [Pseudomonas sp. RIT 412]